MVIISIKENRPTRFDKMSKAIFFSTNIRQKTQAVKALTFSKESDILNYTLI